jgi:protein tyrosine/serine phosphatase
MATGGEADAMRRGWLGRWNLALVLIVSMIVIPFGYYRWRYQHAKRLRVVTPGVLYRSGQLRLDGLEDAVARFRIRTIVNFQNETPDPELAPNLPESAFCRARGIRYVYLHPDLLEGAEDHGARPKAIDRFLDLMDDPANHPVLIHCRAGVHRSGIFAALYRLEYEGWSIEQALRDLRRNGFETAKCNSHNDYIRQYLLCYRPRRELFDWRWSRPGRDDGRTSVWHGMVAP